MRTSTLLFIVGIIWLVAGINVCKIGVECWLMSEGSALLVLACILTFAAFGTMFIRMVFKNIRRIEEIDVQKRRVWDMMSVRSYLIMGFMITLGIILRRSALTPIWFIAFFYTGLGAALAAAGLTYIAMAACKRK